jgi:hypothetical protein
LFQVFVSRARSGVLPQETADLNHPLIVNKPATLQNQIEEEGTGLDSGRQRGNEDENPMREPKLPRNIIANMPRSSPNPKNSPIHLSIVLTFTFIRGDLRTSLTLVVGVDGTLKPSDQPWDQCEDEPKK